ncbi:hypothetical protein L6452_39169 [Arctium lappa]|uniref:Uncharacterized protein n=1 Tax=Arctium lappa TaxID=4217 RepID=A0ACB8XS36_ARCLA|nr:hypothetical protein L6452_39169 [Arctium lappa]
MREKEDVLLGVEEYNAIDDIEESLLEKDCVSIYIYLFLEPTIFILQISAGKNTKTDCSFLVSKPLKTTPHFIPSSSF